MASPLRLALVGGGKAQLAQGAKAFRLYCGPLFRAAYTFATSPDRFDRVFILSASFGLVHPQAELEPGGRTLGQLTAEELYDWAAAVRDHLLRQFNLCPLELTLLAGRLYCEPLVISAQAYALPWAFHQPLYGLSKEARRAWFAQFRQPGAANDAPGKGGRRVR